MIYFNNNKEYLELFIELEKRVYRYKAGKKEY